MKLLICTKEGQGKRTNDFCFTNEGEIAFFGSQCSRATVDDHCGCRRALSGIDSKKGTTTMKVADLPVTHENLMALIKESQISGGWDEPSKMYLESMATELEEKASQWPVGTIVERRRNLQKRRL